jgi:hypothetical protein
VDRILTARLPLTLVDAITYAASERGVSRNALVRAALRAAVDDPERLASSEERYRSAKIRARIAEERLLLPDALRQSLGHG